MIPQQDFARNNKKTQQVQYDDDDNHHVQSRIFSYSRIRKSAQDDPSRLFSSRKPILEADDEMWLYPCRNPDRPDAKEIRRLLVKWGIYEDEN
jgi:hypothetical protein